MSAVTSLDEVRERATKRKLRRDAQKKEYAKGMRSGMSFTRAEVAFMARLARTALRGGDLKTDIRDPLFGKVAGKFMRAAARAEERAKEADGG